MQLIFVSALCKLLVLLEQSISPHDEQLPEQSSTTRRQQDNQHVTAHCLGGNSYLYSTGTGSLVYVINSCQDGQ